MTLRTLDRALLRRVAQHDHGGADRLLRATSRVTDYSALWAAMALVAASTGPRGRRAALEGWLAIATHSLVFNHPIKLATRRARPDPELVPADRRPARTTTTHAFPSGHTGSAVAFTLGVGDTVPAAAPWLGLLAALVGYARIHAGVHHPSDVLGGAVTGTLAGLLARGLWRRWCEDVHATVPRARGRPARAEFDPGP